MSMAAERHEDDYLVRIYRDRGQEKSLAKYRRTRDDLESRIAKLLRPMTIRFVIRPKRP